MGTQSRSVRNAGSQGEVDQSQNVGIESCLSVESTSGMQMIGYMRLMPGPEFRPVNAILYYIQRLVTPAPLRAVASRGIAAGIRRVHGAGPAWLGDEAESDAVTAIKRDGLAIMPAMPAHRVDEMLAFFNARKVIGPAARLVAVDQLPAGCATADYPLKTVLTCPGVLETVNSPGVLRIVARYLGCKPTLTSIWVRWSLPTELKARPSIQTFHRDSEDWRFVKLFVYLTDVDAESGPHEFVKTSHRNSGTLRARSFAAADIEKRYGAIRMVQIKGARGTSFMTDAFGIHKGVPPLRRPRLMLQAQYSLLPCYSYCVRKLPALT
jgi:phytanoyl-CoA dioxygenase PhyH